MRALKTKNFARLRIGISGAGLKRLKSARPTRSKASRLGKKHQEEIIDFVVGKFKPAEEAVVKKALGRAAEAARLFVTDGIEKATMEANTR